MAVAHRPFVYMTQHNRADLVAVPSSYLRAGTVIVVDMEHWSNGNRDIIDGWRDDHDVEVYAYVMVEECRINGRNTWSERAKLYFGTGTAAPYYRNTGTGSTTNAYQSIPDGWLLEDGGGNFSATFTAPGGVNRTHTLRQNFSGALLMNFNSTAYKTNAHDFLDDFLAANDGHIDGLWIDSNGSYIAGASLPASMSGWAQQWFNWAQQLRARYPDLIMIGNAFQLDDSEAPAFGYSRWTGWPGNGNPAWCAAVGEHNTYSGNASAMTKMWNGTWADSEKAPRRHIIIASSVSDIGSWITHANGQGESLWISNQTSSPYVPPASAPDSRLSTGWIAEDNHLAGYQIGDRLDPGGPTAALAATAFSATATGSSVALTWTLPVDAAPRTRHVIARKPTTWGASEEFTAGTAVVDASPGANGAGSFTDTDVPDGTWFYKDFTVSAAGTTFTGPSQSVVVDTPEDAPVTDTYFAHTFTGSAGADPDAAVWSDPEARTSGLSMATGDVDGSGNLVLTVRASVAAVYGSLVMQKLNRLAWSNASRRALEVRMSKASATPAGASLSFYLAGPQGNTTGNTLTSVFAHPNWIRCEHIGSTFRVTRKADGTQATLYTGTAPAAGVEYSVWVLIGPDDLQVMLDGTVVVASIPWPPVGASQYEAGYLYFEASTNDAAVSTVGTFHRARMMRATPHQPEPPGAVVTAGTTSYTAVPAPDDDAVTGYTFYANQVEQTTGAGTLQTGVELDPGDYAIQVRTANPSPFLEV
jgi:hypothetical protein